MPKTSKGRVVYERKVHLFTYKDVLRIIRKVDPRITPLEGPEEILQIVAALLAVFEDLLLSMEDPEVDTPDAMLEQIALQVLGAVFRLMSIVAEKTGKRLSAVIDFWKKLF